MNQQPAIRRPGACFWRDRRCAAMLVVRPARATPASMALAIRRVVGSAEVKPGKVKLDTAAAGGKRQHRGDDDFGRQPDDGRRTTSRRSTSSTRRTRSPMSSACSSGRAPGRPSISTRIRLADTPDSHRDLRNVRRHVLVRQRRGHHHVRRLSRGSDLMAAHPDQRPADSQARRGHHHQDADLAHHGDRLPLRQHRQADPARHHRHVRLHLQRRGDFRATLHPAIAANPFITFHTVATESGTIAFHWTGDNGFAATASANITVE